MLDDGSQDASRDDYEYLEGLAGSVMHGGLLCVELIVLRLHRRDNTRVYAYTLFYFYFWFG